METLNFNNVSEEEQYRIIAAVAYAANRQFSQIVGGKPVNPPWEEYPEDLKQNLITAVKKTVNEKIVSAKLNHLQWVKDRMDMGYEKGENINWKKKTHPDLVPFEELPLSSQLKNVLFLAIVNSLGGALGYRPFDLEPITEEDGQKFQKTLGDLDEAVSKSSPEEEKPDTTPEDPDAMLKEAAKPPTENLPTSDIPPPPTEDEELPPLPDEKPAPKPKAKPAAKKPAAKKPAVKAAPKKK